MAEEVFLPSRQLKRVIKSILVGSSCILGTPVVPFCPFCFSVSLLKLNSRKKGTLVFNGLLWNRVFLLYHY